MELIDKWGVLSRLNEIGDLTLELGCGSHKRHKGAICIDVIDYDCVDIVGDVYAVLSKIPDSLVSAVYSYHFFEHLQDIERIMEELARVIQENGRLVIVTPHFSNPHFYSDYTHKNQFGLYSFSYFAHDPIFVRKVPKYNKSLRFELCKVKLIFKSPPPFYFRWALKQLLQRIFNLNGYMMEFYEENLCYIFPCYEIGYELKKTAS